MISWTRLTEVWSASLFHQILVNSHHEYRIIVIFAYQRCEMCDYYGDVRNPMTVKLRRLWFTIHNDVWLLLRGGMMDVTALVERRESAQNSCNRFRRAETPERSETICVCARNWISRAPWALPSSSQTLDGIAQIALIAPLYLHRNEQRFARIDCRPIHVFTNFINRWGTKQQKTKIETEREISKVIESALAGEEKNRSGEANAAKT